MKKLVLAAALLLCAAAPAAAQEEPSPGEMQAVREFFEASQMRNTFVRSLQMGLEASLPDEELPAGFREMLDEFLAEYLDYDDLEPGFIRMYTDLFTEEELRAMSAFYRTPVGQRLVQLTPDLAVRTQQFTGEVMQEAMPELMRRIMELMEEEQKAPRAPVRGKS